MSTRLCHSAAFQKLRNNALASTPRCRKGPQTARLRTSNADRKLVCAGTRSAGRGGNYASIDRTIAQ
eukprot:368051-Lingulodinium_polyedra.AAC.1